ncbi:MAG: hypothetical protein ACOC2J_03940, partial [bacterium]
GDKNNNKVSKKPFIVTEERETGEGGTKDRCCNDKKLVLNIGLVGRSYVVEDRWINNNIKSSLKNLGCNIVTEKTYRCYHENTSGPTQGLQNNINHFTLTGNSIITIQKMNNDSRIDGIIYLIPFNCGPDAGVELTVKSNGLNKPFLKLVIDEGKGMAGTQTRLEAFIDILNYELVSHL